MASHAGICEDEEGNRAAFALQLAGAMVQGAEYRCTTCVTLVALCEHLRQAVIGATLPSASRWTAGTLIHLHPEIPECRHNRAHLAIRALHCAVQAARNEEP